ncbi:MAG: prepilin-type N-terminal cleavage/methylation domain-containing protein [Gemmatimonadaceae bacterium]
MRVNRMRRRPAHTPRGTTLVELLVAMALLGVFGAIVLAQLRTSGRSLSALALRADAQMALWQGQDVMAAELRSVSPPSGDLRLVTDSSVWYRSVVASGVACSVTPGTGVIELLPDSLSSGMRPTGRYIGAAE